MRARFYVLGFLFIATAVFAMSGEKHMKPGECKDGLCWVRDLQDGQTIAVNYWVINHCKFVDRETVACPKE